jgi:hypothetical protein
MTYGKSILGAGYPLSLIRPAAMRLGSMMQGLWQTLKLWRRRKYERGVLGQFDRRDMHWRN